MRKISGCLAVLLLNLASPCAFASVRCESIYQPVSSSQIQARQIHELLEQSLIEGPGQAIARRKAQAALKFDDMNFTYFLALYEKNKNHSQSESLKLHPATDSRLIAYPVAAPSTPKDISQKFKAVSYADIAKQFDGRAARSTVLVLRKLQAGTGSSMTRRNYFASRPEMPDLLGLNAKDPKLGAKGTDLLVKIEHPLKPGTQVEITIVELQLLQALDIAKTEAYSKLVIQDIVGPETQYRLNQIWNKKSLLDPNLTYAQLFQQTHGLKRAKSLFQSQVPTLNQAGHISLNRTAPAGHGLFAVDALLSIYRKVPQSEKDSQPVVTAIANGEDLNSLPDPVIVDWTVKNKIPIVLVSTTKTPIDNKGGILTLVKDSQTGEVFLKVVETAVAKEAGQLDVFEQARGLVSTNLTLFNHQVLAEKLRRLTEADLLQAISPDIVPNWKEQQDSDGVTRWYLQLEGTMGTSIMNLDRLYRKKFGESLVHVVNIESERRTDFFSPVKSAFDYFLQFHSDRFGLDPETYQLRHYGGEHLPAFVLKDPVTKDSYYQDVQNVLSSFQHASVRFLQSLNISGQVLLRNVVLEGHVEINNQTGHPVDIQQLAHRLPKDSEGRILLKNIRIQWTGNQISIQNQDSQIRSGS